ncbi:hypothetical protein A2715_05985 [Candidatus Woesebacteria bacterium RIFCSPHIGHO2_01_FULL_39_32]|uniref:Transposase IS200-like domain-containing protein n=2 Tax=Candidatus Woeseibacteriota TaxID=1752722 RepID=A0A0G0S719_9BACT|nr:MAG: hypothetical protein UT61_C0005G0021 [Candidatus Woesebacteria bacterium GW2011_GWA1_39_8]OGM05648.1 MAG: hypothetical protein A2124_01400 [Candidatus Woesebacteria bacterium GWB1_37_5]OGM25566.1 MAG: hypothetical protein A2715_05985 [Candidatus Woesebacteria bacterium RIFCSPHIGHO2_01_FULL_39_32]OGM36846.1 MAG: hypothetical protein A3F01_00460 [Candidatus Woesebacteria bacterium RIFCSPHIGHO2_12_FULL_38_11]OGM65097.1 MAG: hypothetical protein A2893_05595 [Candidatus Woesebacteria bacteri
MPRRKTPIVTGQVYHIFNRGVNKQPIFFAPKNYQRATDTIRYYLIHKPPLAYSKFIKLPENIKNEVILNLSKMEKGVEIISYVLMPNHYHLLLRQLIDGAAMVFVRNFQISITKYVNKRFDRTGPLLQGQFKSVLIEDDEQLLHVNRYIHLNPHTSFIVKDLDELRSYMWSSLPEYLGLIKEGFCSNKLILSHFQNITKYWDFVSNQADYQRELDRIKHLVLE